MCGSAWLCMAMNGYECMNVCTYVRMYVHLYTYMEREGGREGGRERERERESQRCIVYDPQKQPYLFVTLNVYAPAKWAVAGVQYLTGRFGAISRRRGEGRLNKKN